jgi:radical SAM protein
MSVHGTTAPPAGAAAHTFPRAPHRVYWELTRACDLACRHCRAEAVPARDPRELDTAAGRRLLEAIREFGSPPPRVILTGGDPLKRPDFWELLEHATSVGLGVSVAPSGTPLLTDDVVRRLKQAGVEAMSLSLDGSTSLRHDRFRGVPGCFERTVAGARAASEAGIPLQVNTLVTAETLPDLVGISALVEGLGAARWSLFFLIQVGRGQVLRQLRPGACEALLRWLWARSERVPFAVTTTEAPHYRRVALQAMQAAGTPREVARRHAIRHGFGMRDGNGILFVSHRGEIQPSGFLPLVAGDVGAAGPVAVYRESPLFQRLRTPDSFGGRCGRCEFRQVCGGSRARAYAVDGDPFGEDPLCLYWPGRGPAA